MKHTHAPIQLRCEYGENPLGIDETRPRLSWKLNDPRRGAVQSAYQILVASSPISLALDKAAIWDSGKVFSDQNIHVEYGGPSLESRQRHFWKVRLWDAHGQPSPWSESAWWEMGLLKPSEWKAKWIGETNARESAKSEPCPHLRKSFHARNPIARARVYVSALGLYEMWINGQRVGNDFFTPGWTDYHVRVQYQTYDVTQLLRESANAMGAILGDGWFCGYLVWQNKRNTWGCPPRLLAQLEIEYVDGSHEMILSDESWKSATGPILESDIYHGEIYDARRELRGWSKPSFNDSGWRAVHVFDTPPVILNASASPRVRKIEEIPSKSLTEPKPGVFVFDLGQNMVGWARLAITGKAGETVMLRFAEILNSDGTIYTTSLRSARCTDRYTLKGDGPELYEPHFTFHGFRYVEVTGFPGRPALDAVTGVVLHSEVRPAGTFECSNAMLNQLQNNIVWGKKGNFLEVPTDCPQRDERLGWTGDAQVFIRTACFNADVAGFFTKWLVDVTDAQAPNGSFPKVAPDVLDQKKGDGGPAWADAGIICPWTIYLCYGDQRILERHYDNMGRYVNFLQTVDHRTRPCFGDWLNHSDDTPKDLLGYAFTAYSTQIMAQIAAILGKKRDATKYRAMLHRVRAAFQKEFVTSTGRLVGDSQTAYVLALQFELLPESLRRNAADQLARRIHERRGHLSTGFVGTPYLLFALLQTGSLDLAYKLLLNDEFPSWGYPIKQGATTMWERWDGWHHDKGFQDAGMNSFNHYAYGAVGEWMYRCIAGIDIDPEQPGYKHILIRPCPGGNLTRAKARHESPYGPIEAEWHLKKIGFTLSIRIPANTWATVFLPCASPAAVMEGGRSLRKADGVSHVRSQSDWTVCDVGAGSYQFRAPRDQLNLE